MIGFKTGRPSGTITRTHREHLEPSQAESLLQLEAKTEREGESLS